MKLPPLKIGEYVASVPIVQGGMSIRISTGKLAGAVAGAGGIGVIGASGMTFDELREEIKIARELAKGGIVAINILFAAKDFLGIVEAALNAGIDIIFSGAGFSRDIYKMVENTRTVFVPIVSSARLALLAAKLGAKAVVVESKEAGGHLGTDRPIRDILPEVVAAMKGKNIPVIAAGGLCDGCDIVEMFKMGASGAQLSTIFIRTPECNAADEYKNVHLNANIDDVILIRSPVGLPGRAIKTKLVADMDNGYYPPIEFCDDCLKNCGKEYCIFDVLKKAQVGDVDNGIVFSGENVYRLKKEIIPAAQIIKNLVREADLCEE